MRIDGCMAESCGWGLNSCERMGRVLRPDRREPRVVGRVQGISLATAGNMAGNRAGNGVGLRGQELVVIRPKGMKGQRSTEN